MKLSNRTIKLKKLRNIFGGLSYVLWIGTLMFLVGAVLSRLGDETSSFLTEDAINTLVSMSTTAVIGTLAAILIKDKIRTFIWMLSLVIGVILFKEIAMYLILGIWFIDEYIIHAFYVKYKNLVVINKEIDRR